MLQMADSTGDVELATSQSRAKIHKFIAQARCPALLTDQFKSIEMSKTAFKALLWFLYSDELCPTLTISPKFYEQWFLDTTLSWHNKDAINQKDTIEELKVRLVNGGV